jgi:hypothetical protein
VAVLEDGRLRQFTRREFGRRALAASAIALGIPRLAHAAPEWIDQRQVGPFVCQAAFPLAGHEKLLAELAPLERELSRVLAVQPCKSPVYLYLMASERQHKAYIAERFPEIPYRRALFIKQDGRSSVFAYLNTELPDDVRHECTHALLHADLPVVPLWLDEGLSEYFEVEKSMRARHHSHLKKLKWDLENQRFVDMPALESKQKLEEMTSTDYRFSWAWVHYMLHGPVAAHAELVTFLNDVRNRVSPGHLSERLAESIATTPGATSIAKQAELANRMRAHFANL